MHHYKRVVAHSANSKIYREPAGGFYTLQRVPLYKNKVTGVTVTEQQKLRRLGISKALAAEFWPDFVPRFSVTPAASTASTKSTGKVRQLAAVTGAVYASRSLDEHEDKRARKQAKRAGKRGRRGRMIDGMRLGTRVHHELHTFTSIMNFAENGFSGSAASCRSVENALSKNGSSGGIHPCTASILQSMRDAWKWHPVAAEWCVGDFSPNGVYATQIDLIALENSEVLKPSPKSRLILCEVKTGYNDGSFFCGNGPMKHVTPMTSNSPQNQAKMQLVMGAAMFCAMYGIDWAHLDLYVIWCPSKGDTLTPRRVQVTAAERDAFLRALRNRQFL